jgi:hypothetical protein
METICFTATARIRRPQSNIVYFDDYHRHLETEKVELPSGLRQTAKHKTFRRRLELLCLLLEAGTCISILLLTITAAVCFFGL